MEKLSFTLYEIFGYFLPGVVGVSAVAILYWALFLPTTPIPVQSVELSKLWYFGLVVVSYFAGHVLQGVSRLMFKNPNDFVLAKEVDLHPVVKLAQDQLATELGMAQTEIPNATATVRLCDELAVQYGQLGDRDVFVYREGFYRGSVAAFILMDFALLVRLVFSGCQLRFSATHTFDVSRWQLVFWMVLVTTTIFVLAQRYKHFAALRVMRSVLAFVALARFQGLSKGAKAGN